MRQDGMQRIQGPWKNYIFIYCAWLVLLWFFTRGFSQGAEWFAPWGVWDGVWYKKIWTDGYLLSDSHSWAFPPAYPTLVGVISSVSTLPFPIAAMILNGLAFFVAGVCAAEVLGTKFNLSRLKIFCFFISSPPSYFIFATYSDCFFAMLLWLTIFLTFFYPHSWRARVAETLLLFAMPLFRLTGYAMASWLLVRRWAALAVFVSLGVWLMFNKQMTGNYKYFLTVQENFDMPEGNILDGIAYAWRYLFPFIMPGTGDGNEGNRWLQFHFLPLAYLFMIVPVGLWLLKRKEYLLAFTLGSIVFISHNQGFWRSVIRYNLPIMPLLAVGLLVVLRRFFSQDRWRSLLFGVWVSGQFLLQLYLANLFHEGQWAF